MSTLLQFVTCTRDDLVCLSATLFKGIDASFLSDSKKPILVSVEGTLRSGKKIIPDTAVEALLGDSAEESGRKEHDEYYIGQCDGKKVEIDFINMAWGTRYGKIHEFFKDTDSGRREFFDQRKSGGISFVHNDGDCSTHLADIVIWIEEKEKDTVVYKDARAKKGQLSALFNKMSALEDSEWVRYVEVDIRHRKLLASPKFRQALEKINSAHQPFLPMSFFKRVTRLGANLLL